MVTITVCSAVPGFVPFDIELTDEAFAVLERYCAEQQITLDQAFDLAIARGLEEIERIAWRRRTES